MTPCTCESDPGIECAAHPVPAATLEAIAGPHNPLARPSILRRQFGDQIPTAMLPMIERLEAKRQPVKGHLKPRPERPCELCQIHAQRTRHHPWPKEILPKGDKRRSAKMQLCGGCHQKIHKALTNRQLFDTYHTIDMLLKHPPIAVWVLRKREHPEEFSRKGFERCYPQGHPKHKPRHER